MILGERISITCDDGREFEGVLMWEHPHYIVLNGLGFAWDMVTAWSYV